jgi:hypothetical protein
MLMASLLKTNWPQICRFGSGLSILFY